MVRVLKKGKLFRYPDFLVRANSNRTSHARFAVVIPKKVLAKAHDRNRARRQVYQLIQEKKGLWEGKSVDAALFFRKFSLTEIEKALLEIFKDE